MNPELPTDEASAQSDAVVAEVERIDLDLPLDVRSFAAFDRSLLPQVRDLRLLTSPPWVRSLGKLALEVTTLGWKFPTPPEPVQPVEDEPTLRIAPRPEP